MEQVNFPFIGPHSGASFWWFPLNHFRLRISPRLATWKVVYIMQPLFTFICRAPSHSGLICDRWLISPLFLRRQISWHISNSAERHGIIHRASLWSGFIHNHCLNLPLFLRRWIKWHALNSAGIHCFNKHAGSQSGAYIDRRSHLVGLTTVDPYTMLNAHIYLSSSHLLGSGYNTNHWSSPFCFAPLDPARFHRLLAFVLLLYYKF